MEHIDSVIYRVRVVVVGVPLILVSIIFLTYLVSGFANAQNTGGSSDYTAMNTYDSPNVVTNSMAALGDATVEAANSTATTIDKNFSSLGTSASNTASFAGTAAVQTSKAVGSAVANSGKFVGRGIAGSFMFVTHGINDGVGFAVRMPGNAVRSVSNIDVTTSLIRPANAVKVPIITPKASAASAPAVNTTPAAPPVPPQTTTGVQWPMHGVITTYFGEAGRPYTAFHGGIDISDANAQGTTPIKPFKNGRVIAVLHYKYGYGNHVIVDHGGGLTSLYAHMYKTAVQVGQEVNLNSVLGYEGRTGLATGPHVHFEIKHNGVPVNPAKYIPGRP